MRINKFIARATGLSRRAADSIIAEGKVSVNHRQAGPGDTVSETDVVTLDKQRLTVPSETTTIMLNKPAGYVCSRNGQGSQTIYNLLPPELHHLKPVGRLDKDSSGLLLLTDDGDLANQLTHPRYAKTKIYEVTLDKPLTASDEHRVTKGVALDDGPSKLVLAKLDEAARRWQVTMQEGRNRQIRRTFEALGYTVRRLHRIRFGDYHLDALGAGDCQTIQ
jgi:23S rRNA pseudouridine2605 synthase